MEVKIRIVKRRTCRAVMLDYFDLEGSRQRPTIGKATTEAELDRLQEFAHREAARISHELAERRHNPAMGEGTIDGALTEFYEHLIATTVTESTKRSYKESIKKFRRFLEGTKATRVKDVTPEIVVQYVKWQDGSSGNTIIAELTRMQRIFRRLVEKGAIGSNPFKHPDVRDVKPLATKHERAFTSEEFESLMEGTRTRNRSPQAAEYADFLLLLGETGARLSEGLMLRWCDVHIEADSYIRIEPHDGWKPKTRSSIRTVPLSGRVEEMLRDRLRQSESIVPTERIFPTNWTPRSVNQGFNRVLTRVGLDGFDHRGQKLRVHSLRHFYATELVRAGVNPATTRDLLGHESITTTNRYFNVPRSELFGAVRSAFNEPRAKNVPNSTRLYTKLKDLARNSPKNVAFNG